MQEKLKGEFLFDWGILNVLVGGQSAIDTEESLNIRSYDEAVKFLECYGFEIENPIERAELFGNFQEAMSFIRRYFLQPQNPEGIKAEIPRKLAELTDPAQVLVMASQGPQGSGASTSHLHLWACAVLKVMHTISHMDKDLRSHYFTDIQKQILDRVYRNIQNDEGTLYLGKDTKDPERIELVEFETKPKKSRDSVLLKLLHKPENVAEDIFDRVGIRFITKNKFDAIRVIKFLKDRYVIMPANAKPSRSRNTLFQLDAFKKDLLKLNEQSKNKGWSYEELYSKLVAACEAANVQQDRDNPHSGKDYSSIQFTCRQLIKIRNPVFEDIKQLKNIVKQSNIPESPTKIIEQLDLRSIQREIRFFYPFEVQVADEKSHQKNLEGSSAHSAYKKSQIQTAMKRVLRGFK